MLPLFEERVRDHIRIRRTELERPRHKFQNPGPRPQKNNIEFGGSLGQKIDIVVRSFEAESATLPPEFNPAFIFKIKLDKGAVTADNWRLSNLTVLSEETDGTVVLFSPDQLERFRNRIDTYSEPILDGKKNPRQGWIASLTEEMELWGRENRIGRKLSRIEIDLNAIYYLDVESWVYGSSEENMGRYNSLVQFIERNEGRVTDHYISEDLFLARVMVSGRILNSLLDIGTIREIDLPPEPLMEFPEYFHTQIDDFPNPINIPDEGSPGICIIDSGVATGHPILSNAIGEAKTFPINLGTEIDQCGHGTMVSGLALYGDVKSCIDNLNFTPEISIYSARVTNNQNKFDDDSLIVTQMEQAIHYFFETYGCRVFNISLGDPSLVYADGKPSSWANTLDILAKKHDVVIVVSAGNTAVVTNNRVDAETIRNNYPSYLLNNNSRILEPATAVNVITVGSICNSVNSFRARDINQLVEPISDSINLPSPFTRCGPGVNGAIKPDVVEYGGNVAWSALTGQIAQHDVGLEIVSINFNYRYGRLFSGDVGTSFSTAKISHLAGLILKKYPGISANMVRALIANAAEIPTIALDRFPDKEDIKKLYGFGLPNQQKALYSTGNRVLLMSDDEIINDGIHVYEIPIPELFKITKGERIIQICLAFDPPVRHTRKDYIGINLEFKLLRGCTTEQIFEFFSNLREKGDDPIPARFNCGLQPSIQNRGGGTLQKAEFRIKRNSSLLDYDGEKLHLLIQSKKGWAEDASYPSQKYAVTVSLEHLGAQIDIYNFMRDQVRPELRERDRARVRG